MRKLVSLAVVLTLTSSIFVGCSSTEDKVDDSIIPPIEEGMDDLVDGFDDGMEDLTENFEEMYQDGVYRAEFTEYTDGYKDYVEITINDGKIDKVDHNGINENGELKTLDDSLKTQYLEKYETYPAEYMSMYSTSLMDNQTLDILEVHKGTEKESENFKKLAEKALYSAKNGKTEIATVENSTM